MWKARQGLSANVILTGFTSFFTDVSSEMIYPLLQAFVRFILAGQRSLLGPALGVIEGIAESSASLLRVFSGYYSDRIRQRKLPAIGGYGVSAAAKAALAIKDKHQHTFKTENDEEARKAMFRHMEVKVA